jgi:hypothetical protein
MGKMTVDETLKAAREQVATLKAYWRARGYDCGARIVKPTVGDHDGHPWTVRTNMINGIPAKKL